MESLLAKLFLLFQGVDSTFSVILLCSIALFFMGEIFWWRASRQVVVPGLPQDDTRLKFVWTIVPALVLAILLSVHDPRSRRNTTEIAQPSPPSRPEVRPAAATQNAVPPVVQQGGV